MTILPKFYEDNEERERAARNKLGELEDLRQKTQILDLAVKGFRPYQIQEKLGIAASAYTRHMQDLTTMWREAINVDSSEYFGKIYLGYEATLQAAWEGYERSTKVQTKIRKKAGRVGGEDGVSMVVTEQTEESSVGPGDPSFLYVISSTLARMAKLTGLDKAVSIMLTQNTVNITEAKEDFQKRIEEFNKYYEETHPDNTSKALEEGYSE